MPIFQARARIIFHIRSKPILLKSAASFFIWYPNVPCSLFSVSGTDIKQTARRIVWEEMSVSIRQATFRSVYVHCCRHFTNQVNIWIYFMHTLLVSARCVLWLVIYCKVQEGNYCVNKNNTRQHLKEIKNSWTSAWKLKIGCQKEYMCVCQWTVCVCFDLTPMLPVRKEYFRYTL
jgi:hypothetical protein